MSFVALILGLVFCIYFSKLNCLFCYSIGFPVFFSSPLSSVHEIDQILQVGKTLHSAVYTLGEGVIAKSNILI